MELELFLVLLVTTGLVEATRVGHLVPARSPFAALAYEEGRKGQSWSWRKGRWFYLIVRHRASSRMIQTSAIADCTPAISRDTVVFEHGT